MRSAPCLILAVALALSTHASGDKYTNLGLAVKCEASKVSESIGYRAKP